MKQTDAHAEVRNLCAEIRRYIAVLPQRTRDAIERDTDMIETITRAFMVPTIKDTFEGIVLEPQELRLANLLKAKIGRCVSHDAIMDAIYFDRSEECGNPAKFRHVRICRLRKKLPGYRIENVHGQGYRMVSRETGIPIPASRH